MMNQNKQLVHNFIVCFRFFFLKSAAKLSNLFFVVALPVLWAIVSMVLSESSKTKIPFGPEGKMLSSIILSAAGILFFGTFFVSTIGLPNNLALDRIHKRLKIYRTMGIGQNTYVITNVLSLFVIYFPIFLIQLLVLNFTFELNLSAGIFILTIVINVVAFFATALLGIFFSTLSKTDKGNYMINAMLFFALLIFAGILFPPAFFDVHLVGMNELYQWVGKTKEGDYSWFKFVQFLSPIGTGIYFVQNIIIKDVTGVSLFSWDVDWIGIVLQAGLVIFFYLSCIKQFKWK